MLVQFQKGKFWTASPSRWCGWIRWAFRHREHIPTNRTRFTSYDKAIVSVTRSKNDRIPPTSDKPVGLFIVIDECQNVAARARGHPEKPTARAGRAPATRSET